MLNKHEQIFNILFLIAEMLQKIQTEHERFRLIPTKEDPHIVCETCPSSLSVQPTFAHTRQAVTAHQESFIHKSSIDAEAEILSARQKIQEQINLTLY